MPANPKLIVKLIGESVVGFSNAKTHDEIKERIIQYGYDDAKLDELLVLNTLTSEKNTEYERLYGEQLESTSKLNEKYEVEFNYYAVFRQIAFRVFSGDNFKGIRSQLGIDLRAKASFEGFIEQATQFYDAAMKNQEILQGMSEIALTNEKIQERLNGLSVLRSLNDAQESAKGKAKIANKDRDDTYKALRKEWSKFKIICRHLFKGKEEYLKVLNIKPKKKRTSTSTNTNTPDDNQENQQEQQDQQDQ